MADFAPITPIAPITGLTPSTAIDADALRITDASAAAGIGPTQNAKGSTFADILTQAQGVETKANNLAVDLATGKLDNPHDFTAAASEAKLVVELLTTVRNRATDATSELFRMQV